jgi:sugar (pentulose or hexulose) kinase
LEKLGYDKLQELGANPLKVVYSAGGGAKNPIWQKIRQRLLGVEVQVSPQSQAAYGSALLAKNGLGLAKF